MQEPKHETDPDLILYGDLCHEIALARRMTGKLTTRDGHYPGNLGTVANALSRAKSAVDALIESDLRTVDPDRLRRTTQKRRHPKQEAKPEDTGHQAYLNGSPARLAVLKLLRQRGPLSAREILDEIRVRVEPNLNGAGIASLLRGLGEREIIRQVEHGSIHRWEAAA